MTRRRWSIRTVLLIAVAACNPFGPEAPKEDPAQPDVPDDVSEALKALPEATVVQWTNDGQGGMGWPPLDYVRELMACMQRCIDLQTDADVLLSQIVALGNPLQYRPTFVGLGSDATLPRVGGDTKLLRVQGPIEAMTPALTAMCSMLSEASDLLGIRFDTAGMAQDFLICRHFESGAALASIFDGSWSNRGWTSYESLVEGQDVSRKGGIDFDDDTTQPLPLGIDTAARPPDSQEPS